MVDPVQLIVIIDLVILIIIEILCWIYLLTILFVKRFHTTVNILTGNVCLASILCCLFWIIYYISSTFYRSIFASNGIACILNLFFPEMFNSFVIYTLGMVTINRFFSLIYPNNSLLKRKRWALVCSAMPWIVVLILCTPKIFYAVGLCTDGRVLIAHIEWYLLVMIILLPSSIKGIFNVLIFLHVRASTRRIRAVTTVDLPHLPPLNQQSTRDIRLLKHILFMFIIFVAGWTPIYLMPIFGKDQFENSWLPTALQVLPVISALITVLDLFWYNYDLRRCLQDHINRNIRLRRQN